MSTNQTETKKLAEQEIRQRIAELDGWQLVNGKLEKEFVFRNFIEAFGFMTQVALKAEKQGHHPEWSNVYNRVRIALTTHELDGISERDFQLAATIDCTGGREATPQ